MGVWGEVSEKNRIVLGMMITVDVLFGFSLGSTLFAKGPFTLRRIAPTYAGV